MGIQRLGGRGALVACAVLVAAACGDESEGGGSTAVCDDVEAKLDAMNVGLGCPSGGEVLADMCRRGLSAKPSCKAQVQALHDCVKDQPQSEWQCHPVGEYPAMRGNLCSAENDAVGTCFDG
ncbi:MAG TPA: hypothetical protein VI072_13760 [Polyangiaceae bacterium]